MLVAWFCLKTGHYGLACAGVLVAVEKRRLAAGVTVSAEAGDYEFGGIVAYVFVGEFFAVARDDRAGWECRCRGFARSYRAQGALAAGQIEAPDLVSKLG